MTIIKLHIFACEQILHKQIKKRVKNSRKYSVKLHIKPVHAFMKINNNFLSMTLITTFASSFRKTVADFYEQLLADVFCWSSVPIENPDH